MKATCLKWHGGKAYLADWIASHFPPRDSYVTYAEPFFGGGSVLFAHDPEGKSEVVNDLNLDLTVFWRVVKSDTGVTALKNLLESTPFSQIEFEDAYEYARTVPPELYDSVRHATAFFIRNRQSRQGLMRDFATMSKTRTRRGMNEQVSSWLSAIEGLPEFHARLKRVAIFNEDAIKFIKRVEDWKTLFYIDPPYLHETRSHTTSYQHEMTEVQHATLLSTLRGLRAKFILSGYPSELYEHHAREGGWRCVTREIDNKSSSAKSKERKTECLWMNY